MHLSGTTHTGASASLHSISRRPPPPPPLVFFYATQPTTQPTVDGDRPACPSPRPRIVMSTDNSFDCIAGHAAWRCALRTPPPLSARVPRAHSAAANAQPSLPPSLPSSSSRLHGHAPVFLDVVLLYLFPLSSLYLLPLLLFYELPAQRPPWHLTPGQPAPRLSSVFSSRRLPARRHRFIFFKQRVIWPPLVGRLAALVDVLHPPPPGG